MYPDREWREKLWAELDQPWDLLVIGGGITGAGILREAARYGLRTLLVEQHDFAAGTSSRSSKLVHGGLRYLKTGQWQLTVESVRERERLLREAPGLVEPIGFVLPVYAGQRPAPWMLRAGLLAYDAMAGRLRHRPLDANEMRLIAPRIREQGLLGGFVYPDAQTDDARLTLRVLQEAIGDGGRALNYARVETVAREGRSITGVQLRDARNGREASVRATVIVNATGSWADLIRRQLGVPTRLRPLRGSHLVFPFHRLPVAQAVSLFHPRDRRPVFVFPWEGAVIVGTTDLDHREDLNHEAVISRAEIDYLMEAVHYQFPGLWLKAADALCSYSGVRPVIASGQGDPSKESREFALWEEAGMLTVTGGKLTTFRTTALQVLRKARARLPALRQLRDDAPVFAPHPPPVPALRRLHGRYGALATQLLAEAGADGLRPVAESVYVRAELLHAARREAVVHLEDLLLRRTRIGLVAREGGIPWLPEIRELCQPALGWSDGQWDEEESAYCERWQRYHRVPSA